MYLDTTQVAKAALKAYKEGRLSAQGPTPECAYRDSSGRPCAIGAAIPDKLAEVLTGSIFAIISTRGWRTNNIQGLSMLQAAHDDWVCGPKSRYREEDFVKVAVMLAGGV